VTATTPGRPCRSDTSASRGLLSFHLPCLESAFGSSDSLATGPARMSDTTNTSSAQLEALVRAAALGDIPARDELLRRYWPLICKVVRERKNHMPRALRLREETQDLEQQVAIRVLREIPKHEWQNSGALAAWIRRLADAEVIDVHRYHKAQKRDRGAEDELVTGEQPARQTRGPETRMDQQAKVDALEAALDKIKPEYANAVRLNALGYSHPEIGAILGCTPEAARKLVARGLSKLQQIQDL
jgi:RNA polymerase sigma factor (sigma-70 family)